MACQLKGSLPFTLGFLPHPLLYFFFAPKAVNLKRVISSLDKLSVTLLPIRALYLTTHELRRFVKPQISDFLSLLLSYKPTLYETLSIAM